MLILVALAIVSVVADVQPFADVGDRFIGHADQANVAMVARNIAEGNGAVTDCVWLLHGGGRSGCDVRHPEGYWSIYVAGLLAPFFKLLGANRETILLVASLTKMAIAICAAHWVYRFSCSCLAAVACGTFLLLDSLMTQQVNGLSDIYLTLCILLSVTAMIWAIERHSKIGWFVTGVLAGLAVGMKPSGLIMIGVFLPCILCAAQRRTVFLQSWALLAGFALAIAPLAIHNYKAAGTVLWPDLRLVRSAAATRGFGGEHWNAAAYDPTIPVSSVQAFSNEWCKRRVLALFGFSKIFVKDNSIVPMWLLPFVFYAFVRHVRAWWRAGYVCQDPQDIFVAATFLLTCGAFCLGAIVHVEPRYWNFLVPVFAVVGISVCAKHAREFVVFALLIGAGFGAMHMKRLFGSVQDARTELVATYRTLDALIPEKAVVMTQNPWEFSFHTRRLSVVLPYNSKDEVVQDVALRYGVEYLVIINRDARHPGFNQLEDGVFPSYLKPIHNSDNLVIGRFEYDSVP